MKNNCLNLFSITVGVMGLLLSGMVSAEATLRFSPQRVVMEGHQKSATLSLTNRGDKAAVFRVSMSDVVYANDGSVKLLDAPPPGFPSARPYIRFSPSQVRLNPGESQSVRILLMSADKLPPGELRVHFSMAQLPDGPSLEDVSQNQNIAQMKMAIGQAVAIPIIVRRGETQAKGGVGAVRRTPQGLDVTLTRQGNRSLYTDVEVYAGAVAPERQVGIIRGVAVPVPNPQRLVHVPLKGQGNILIVRDHDSNEVIAQRNI